MRLNLDQSSLFRAKISIEPSVINSSLYTKASHVLLEGLQGIRKWCLMVVTAQPSPVLRLLKLDSFVADSGQIPFAQCSGDHPPKMMQPEG